MWKCITRSGKRAMWKCITGSGKRPMLKCITGSGKRPMWKCITGWMVKSPCQEGRKEGGREVYTFKGWRYGLLIGSIRSDRICLNICGVSAGSIWLKTSSIRFDMPFVEGLHIGSKFREIILDRFVL